MDFYSIGVHIRLLLLWISSLLIELINRIEIYNRRSPKQTPIGVWLVGSVFQAQSVWSSEIFERRGCVLAWQHCLTHICQEHCNYLAEATGHRKNAIRTKIVPSCPQLPGQRFGDKSRSAVWLEELALSCLGLSQISCKYPFDPVCSQCKLQIVLVKVASLVYRWNVWVWKVDCLLIWGVTLDCVSEITAQYLRPALYDSRY